MKDRDRSKCILRRLLTHEGAMSVDTVTSRKGASSTRISQSIVPLRKGLVYHSAPFTAQTAVCVSVSQRYNKHLPQSTGRQRIWSTTCLHLSPCLHTHVIWSQSASQSPGLTLDTIISIPLSQFPRHRSVCPSPGDYTKLFLTP